MWRTARENVELLGAAKHRPMFRMWVANSTKFKNIDRSLEGAVLKFVRLKKGLALEDLGGELKISARHLSRVEKGIIQPTVELRKKVLVACDYSPASFKNLYADPERSKAVPARFKLDILLGRLPEEKLQKVYGFVEQLIDGESEELSHE